MGSETECAGGLGLSKANFCGWYLPIGGWVICAFILCILFASLGLFFAYVGPSLSGENDLRIGADSSYYLWRAGVSQYAPADFGDDLDTSWVSLQGGVIGPAAVARLLRSNFLILCFDYLIFALAVSVFSESISLNVPLFTLLLLINPSILVSVLTLNKEVLVLLSIALLFKYMSSERKSWMLLFGVFLLSCLSRWQNLLVIAAFLFLTWSSRRLKNRRGMALLFLIIFISFVYPFISPMVDVVLGTAEVNGNTIILLSNAQRHFLYFAVVIPKVALNLYGDGVLFLLHGFAGDDSSNIYGSCIVPLSSLACIVMTIWFIFSRTFSFKNDRLYFAVIYSMLFSTLPFVQTRYFFPIYVILCLEVASSKSLKRPMARVNLEI